MKLPVFCWLRVVNQLASALVLLVLVSACGDKAARSELDEDKAFPHITLHKVAGGTVSSDSFRGKLLVLNVWSVWCVPCRREMPSLERLSKTLDPQRFTVIGLSAEKDEAQVQKFLGYYGVTFENFLDRDGVMLKQLDVKAYPVTFLVAPDGSLVQRVLGEQDWSGPAMIQVLEEAYHGRRSRIGGGW